MAYSIEQARTDLKRSTHWLTQSIDFAPISGLADGTNTIFHLPNFPADSSSALAIYDYNGVAHDGYTVLNWDAGSLRFSSGSVPAETLYASYTAQAIKDSALLNICKAGFDDMQARYQRDYYLVESTGGSSFVSSASASVVDPVCGSRVFSTSRVQVSLLLACCEYVLVKSLATDLALRAYAIREERVGGLMIDRSRQAGAFDALLKLADKKANDATAAAMAELGVSSEFGSFIPGAKSDTYTDSWDWWTDSNQANGL